MEETILLHTAYIQQNVSTYLKREQPQTHIHIHANDFAHTHT